MVNVPIHTGAIDGIMTLTGILKRANNKAVTPVNNAEDTKLKIRNFTLFFCLIGNAWGGMCP
jgi:hypothetical protein